MTPTLDSPARQCAMTRRALHRPARTLRLARLCPSALEYHVLQAPWARTNAHSCSHPRSTLISMREGRARQGSSGVCVGVGVWVVGGGQRKTACQRTRASATTQSCAAPPHHHAVTSRHRGKAQSRQGIEARRSHVKASRQGAVTSRHRGKAQSGGARGNCRTAACLCCTEERLRVLPCHDHTPQELLCYSQGLCQGGKDDARLTRAVSGMARTMHAGRTGCATLPVFPESQCMCCTVR